MIWTGDWTAPADSAGVAAAGLFAAAGSDRSLRRCARTFIDGGDHVVVLGRYRGAMKNSGTRLVAPFCHVFRFQGEKAVMFQQFTAAAQWMRLMT